MDRTLSLLVKFSGLDRLSAPLRAMGTTAKASQRAILSTRKEITDLGRTAGKAAGLRRLREEASATHGELDTTRRRIRDLRAALAQADGPTGRLTRSLEAAEGKLARLSRTSDDQSKRIGKLGRELADAGVDVTRLARHEEDLARSIGDANRRLDEQTARLARRERADRRLQAVISGGQRMAITGAGMMAGSAAMGAPLVIAVKDAAEFKSSMTDIALKTGMTADQADAMGRRLGALAPKVAQLPEALQAGVDLLAGKGLAGDIAERLIGPIGMAAAAAKADLKDLSEAGFAAYANLGVAVDRMPGALDAMYVAGKKGAVELKDMATFMPALGAAAAALGQKGVRGVADLAAALQIAEKGTGSAEGAATNLQNLLQKMNAPDTVKNFEKFGVDLPRELKKLYAAGKTPLEAIAMLTDRTLKGDLSRLGYLFGDAQAQGGVRSLIQNLEEYRRVRADAEKGGGELGRDFRMREGGGEFVSVRAQGQISRFKDLAGNLLLPTVNDLLEKFGVLAGRVTEWANANPQLATTIVKVGGALLALSFAFGAIGAVLGPVIGGFGTLWKAGSSIVGFFKAPVGQVSTFRVLLTRAAPAMRLFGGLFGWIARGAMLAVTAIAGFLGLPVIAVAAIGAGLALAGLAIYNHWDKIKAFFAAAPAWFANIGKAMIAGLIRGIKSLAPSVPGLLASLIPGGGLIGGLVGASARLIRPVANVAPVRTARPAGAGRGGPVTIHVTQRPGEDGAAFARRTADHIAEDRRAARRRDESSYRDRD